MSLQRPQIIGIEGRALRIKHPSFDGYTQTTLAAPVAAAATGLSVFDNLNFTNADHIVIGYPGVGGTESRLVSVAVTRGQSLTIGTGLTFAHIQDTPITVSPEAKIQVYRNSVDSFTGATLITTIDIQFAKGETTYYIPATSSDNFYMVRFANSAATETSEVSISIAAEGYEYRAVSILIRNALNSSNSIVDEELLTWDFLVYSASEAQQKISQTISGSTAKNNWAFEIFEDYFTGVANQRAYNLNSLNAKPKYEKTNETFINVIFDSTPLQPRTRNEIDLEYTNKEFTETTALASIGDITLTVRSTGDFQDTGVLEIAGQSITYTGRTATTFTGIPATGTGSITASIAVGAEVWSSGSFGRPARYCVSQNQLILDKPLDPVHAGQQIYMRYYGQIPRLTELGSETPVQFTDVIQLYIIAKIEYAKGNKELAVTLMQKFDTDVQSVMNSDIIETSKVSRYYNYVDTDNPRDKLTQTNF